MRIVCPKCHAAYQVDAVIKNAILVCHRCNTEFDSYGNSVTVGNATAQIFKAQEEAAPTFGLYDLVQSGAKSRNTHIWLAMVVVLMGIAIAGVATRWEHWEQSSVVRAYDIESNLSAPVFDRDWRILPDSIHTQWLTRDDQSVALIIEGQVENLVATALPSPEIQITFVTQMGKNIDMVQAITEPAALTALKTVPFTSPPVDKVPVPSLGTRGFLLLVEDAPQSTQHILLHALAVQRQGKTQL